MSQTSCIHFTPDPGHLGLQGNFSEGHRGKMGEARNLVPSSRCTYPRSFADDIQPRNILEVAAIVGNKG